MFMLSKEVFQIKSVDNKINIMHAHFNWHDDTYTIFMMNLMNILEPLEFEKG